MRYLDVHADDQLDEEPGELDSAGVGAARLGPVAPGSANPGAAYDEMTAAAQPR